MVMVVVALGSDIYYRTLYFTDNIVRKIAMVMMIIIEGEAKKEGPRADGCYR